MESIRKYAYETFNKEIAPGKVDRSKLSAREMTFFYLIIVSFQEPHMVIHDVLIRATLAYVGFFLVSFIGRRIYLPVLKRVAYPLNQPQER